MRLMLVLMMVGSLVAGCAGRGSIGAGAAAGAGAATGTAVKGEYRARYDASMERVWKAVLQTMDELKNTVYSTRKGSENVIEATTKEGKDVRIVLEPAVTNGTLVKIWIAGAPDDSYAQLVDKAIQQKLEKKTQTKPVRTNTAVGRRGHN